MWEPATRRVLALVGLAPGARCLDVGCGPGATMRLMAERVGARGRVVGVDADTGVGALAVSALHADGHRQCEFEPGDVEAGASISAGRFDLVFARMLLLHVDDPAAVLHRMWECVAPGGHLVVQDYDLAAADAFPALESMDEFKRVVNETFEGAGRESRVGVRLPGLFAETGLGIPDGTDVAGRFVPLEHDSAMLQSVYRSLLPAALSLGVTTDSRSRQWFRDIARDSARPGRHTLQWPLLIAAWKRRPAR
jgi:SAM-dependent methyltransferase